MTRISSFRPSPGPASSPPFSRREKGLKTPLPAGEGKGGGPGIQRFFLTIPFAPSRLCVKISYHGNKMRQVDPPHGGKPPHDRAVRAEPGEAQRQRRHRLLRH